MAYASVVSVVLRGSAPAQHNKGSDRHGQQGGWSTGERSSGEEERTNNNNSTSANMRLIRAHDGVAFDFPQEYLLSIHSLSALLELISPELQIEPNQIILMNALGSQLSDGLLNSILHPEQSPAPSTHSTDSSNLLSLKPSPTRPSHGLLYAFDRQLVSADPSETLNALASEAENVLEPPLPSLDLANSDLQEINNLALSYYTVGSNHLRTTLLLLSHVRAQKSALEVALNNLDKCRESPSGALEAYETFAQPLVQDYGQLLEAFGPSFALAKSVKIHPALLPFNALVKSNSSTTQLGGGNTNSNDTMKVKYMGDYVMEDKILQVRDRCLKVYEDFRTRFDQIRANSAEVNEGATTLRKKLNGGDCHIEDLYELEKDADDGFHRIEQVTTQIHQVVKEVEPMDSLVECFSELAVLDEDSRERISCLIERKNWWLHYHVDALNQISHLQTLIPSIGSEVQSLNDDLKTRTDSFRHLARLKDFVTAYASTVVEVVRRREYARHLADYASALNNLISKLSNDERRRRGAYRSEFSGKLPFAVEGLDDSNVPTIEFEIRYIGAGGATVPRTKDAQITGADLPPLTRADVDQMVSAFRNIEESADKDAGDGNSPKVPAREVRLLIQKQFSRLEAMENAFAHAVERFVMSDSESYITGQPADPEEVLQLRARVAELQSIQENLTEQLRVESTASITASRKAQQETQICVRKAEDLKLQLLSVKEEARHEKERLIQDQQSLITEIANTHGTIEKLTSRTTQLEDELKLRSKALQDTERQLTSARATADDATRELHDLEARHRDHISDHEVVLNRLQQSRDRCKELEHELAEIQSRNKTLSSQIEDQNQLIDRRAAEAEDERLRMEKENLELRSQLEDEKHQNSGLLNKVTQKQMEIEHMSHQSKLLVEAHAAAQSRWKEETTESTSRLENHCLKAVHALESYQHVHRTVKDRIVNMPRPGSSQKSAATAPNNPDSQSLTAETSSSVAVAATSPKSNSMNEKQLPSPSSAEFEALLQSLLQFDYDSLIDVVQQKLDQLSISIRKWMKDSKGYRERANRSQEQAQVKITFRDFAKGDLALFLPTRNPSAQVWAAFNVSFPHYFLQANETVAPIIRSREWLVARIVSLTEKMVDPRDPETNPYQLPAGTRYFLLEVEPWSVEKSSRRLAQSIPGGNSVSRPRMQNQMRSATLSSQTAPPNVSPLAKRRSLVGVETKPEQTSSEVQISDPVDPKESTNSAETPASESNTLQANHLNSELNQSEYTVIDRSSSPVGAEPTSDSPFRTTINSPTRPTRIGPSGLSLSLKTYNKSPLGPTSSSSKPSCPQPPSEVEELDDAAAFRPSESSRPAFLANMSLTKLPSIPRKPPGSPIQAPAKPRLRPVPKAQNASRSSSRAPSVSSSLVNLNPAVKAMLNPASPLHKGSSTVSTTFTSMENSLSSPRQSSSNTREPDPLGQSAAMIQMMRPSLSNNSPSSGTISSVINLAKRRISFPGGTNNNNSNNKPMTMVGSSSGTGGSQNSSLSGSGLFIGNSPSNNHVLVNKTDGGGGTPISPSFTNHNPSGSGFFGSWRKRKESNNHVATSSISSPTPTPTPASLPPSKNMDINPSPNCINNSNIGISTPSGSFAGASDLLKRFSHSHKPS